MFCKKCRESLKPDAKFCAKCGTSTFKHTIESSKSSFLSNDKSKEGYFYGMVNASFKNDTQGNTLFYKWGFLGKAYVIPYAEKENEIREFLMFFYGISLALSISVSVLTVEGNWFFPSLILWISLLIWYQIKISSLTRDLPISYEKLSLKESYNNSAQGHKEYTLWFLSIGSILFFICGLFILIIDHELKEQLFGASFAIMFGALSVAAIYMLKTKRKNNRG